MSITTLDGAIAGMQATRMFHKAVTPTLVAGKPQSLWYLAGVPGAGVADTSTANGVVRNSTSALVSGQINHLDPGAGNSYLANFNANASLAGLLMLADRLWDCGANTTPAALSPTLTTAQTITSATWPARDNAGSTNGAGVYIALEVSTALGAGTPTYTLAYTNSAGTGSRSGTNLFATAASSSIGSFYEFGLQAGDLGVKSVQTVTASATQTSGQWVLVAYRPLVLLELTAAFSPNGVNLSSGGFQQLYNGVVPFLVFVPNTTTASNVMGSYTETQG